MTQTEFDKIMHYINQGFKLGYGRGYLFRNNEGKGEEIPYNDKLTSEDRQNIRRELETFLGPII